MTTHVIYHSNCVDGFTAAWAAWKALGKGVVYLPAFYGSAPPELPKDARVVILDFSYSRPVLEKMRVEVAALTIIDHHKTAAVDLKDFPNAIFDLEHSGAYLAWKYFHPSGIVPQLVRYVDDRDLWKFALPHSREAAAYVQSFPYDFQAWEDLYMKFEFSQLPLGAGSVADEGGAILRAQDQLVKKMAAQYIMRDIGGHRVPVVNASCYFSEVGSQLCEDHPEAPFAAYYFDRGDGKRQWGLRSRNGFDVSVVAKQFGGGGHPGAAGFEEPLKA